MVPPKPAKGKNGKGKSGKGATTTNDTTTTGTSGRKGDGGIASGLNSSSPSSLPVPLLVLGGLALLLVAAGAAALIAKRIQSRRSNPRFRPRRAVLHGSVRSPPYGSQARGSGRSRPPRHTGFRL